MRAQELNNRQTKRAESHSARYSPNILSFHDRNNLDPPDKQKRTARGSKVLGVWPRLLSADLAAFYCGVSARTFITFCPIVPIKIGARVLYDRLAVDRWLDSLGVGEGENLKADDWLGRLDDVHAA